MKRHSILLLVLLLTVTLWKPAITEGPPYFYNEDEAHHFNRVVNMVKTGDFNPHYFHKPSLHFYLRMPIVGVSFLWGVREGQLRSIKEIITTDEEGIGGYAFSASHPGIVKWNRAFSLFLGLVTTFLCYLIAFEITHSRTAGIFALVFCAVSPELLKHSAVIGVDVVMTFFSVLTTYLGVRCCKIFTIRRLALCAVCAGLAISSKYNALPIVSVPLLVGLYLSSRKLEGLFVAVLSMAAGFFIASPFILAELPIFLDHLAYEIWHYKIAGHEGHSGEPGWGQLLFYLGWLKNDALGLPALIAALVGLLILVPRYKIIGVIVLAAPLLFFLLMIDQRANFTRNMIFILPYLSVFIAVALKPLLQRARNLGIALGLLLAFLPLLRSFTVRAEMKENRESRIIAEKWLAAEKKIDTGILPDLEIAPSIYAIPAVARAPKTSTPIELYQEGFDRILTRGDFGSSNELKLEREFPGESAQKRITKNPHIKIWGFNPEGFERDELNGFLASPRANPVNFERSLEGYECRETAEPYCWIKQRTTRVYLRDIEDDPNFSGRDGLIRLSINLMTPWDGQIVRLTFDDFLAFIEVPLKDSPGQWQSVEVDMPYQELKSQGYFIVSISQVHSPHSWVQSPDNRRLGLAIKDIRILSR